MILQNCSAEEFILRLKGRKVICFGAGALMCMPVFLEEGHITGLEDHIAFFVDNDPNKWGCNYLYGGRLFPVYGPESLSKIQALDYVLLVTCLACEEVYRQLAQDYVLSELECYFYRFVTHAPNVDVQHFLEVEAKKDAYANWKEHLLALQLKDKHRGQRCFLIGNGPSLRVDDLEALKEEVTFGVNQIYTIFEKTNWRPTYYLCVDHLIYMRNHKKIHKMLSKSLKFTCLRNAIYSGVVYDDIFYISRLPECNDTSSGTVKMMDEPLFSYDMIDGVYMHSTVLYSALQMAVYMGFSEIYLIGVDCNFKLQRDAAGRVFKNSAVVANHFSSEYECGLEEECAIPVETYRMLQGWEAGKKACEQKKIVFKNATRGGNLEVLERISLDKLLKEEKREPYARPH